MPENVGRSVGSNPIFFVSPNSADTCAIGTVRRVRSGID